MPTDFETGLPYAILPIVGDADGPVNYHHHFYPRRSPFLEGLKSLDPGLLQEPHLIELERLGGLAVRISRGQLMSMQTHRLGHESYPEGPDLPKTLDEQFETAVKACSGIVSRWALDLTGSKENRLVHMDDEMFNLVASPRNLCAEKIYRDKPADTRRKVLGSFFLRYAIQCGVEGIEKESEIDEFMGTNDDARRIALGNHLLKEVMNIAIDPLVADYVSMRDKGMVHPSRPSLRSVVWKQVHPNRLQLARASLHVQLAA